ncbi:MAG TPA: alpha/beta hydrolase [Candidatus Dormibacteraeota bacterium]|nr:alpha/beta hydrolase [Candidatus Dormibacteraeota bacterium]
MKLNVREWGEGDRLAILIHGITSDSRAWVRVGPALAERGYRVLAPDLRGHGQSPRGEYCPRQWASDLAESVPSGADVAIGHSLGGMALALAVDDLKPRRAVYEDPAWITGGGTAGRAEVVARFAAGKNRTVESLRQESPRWTDADIEGAVAAAALWDESSSEVAATGWDVMPERAVVPSLVLLADPSQLIPPERAEELRRRGFEVRTVAGTGHSIHRDDLDGFLAAMDGWI